MYKDKDGNEIYFKKDWNEINVVVIKGGTYYVTAYPLDIYDSDTLCIRAYTDKEKTDECGNGLWIDSDMGIADGNDELYFSIDDNENTEIEDLIINTVFEKLKQEEII